MATPNGRLRAYAWRGTQRARTGSVNGTSDTSGMLRAAGRHGAKGLMRAIVPKALVAWQGSVARSPADKREMQGRRPLALTFDDGPSDLTPAYLEVLKRFDVRATFFVVGELCAARPELVSAIAADGHELSAHGYTHRRFPSLSRSELQSELTGTASLLPRRSGRRRPFVRPPHGAISLSSILTCANAGFTTVLWSHDSGDWCTTSDDDVCAAFDDERALEPGAIVLLHEGQPWTLRALPRVLGKLREAGHDLVTVGELLGD